MPYRFLQPHYYLTLCRNVIQVADNYGKAMLLTSLALLAMNGSPANASEGMSCSEVFSVKDPVDLSALLGQYERAASEFFVDNPENLSKFQKNIGGLPYRLFSLRRDDNSSTTRIEKNEPFYRRYRERTIDELRSISKNKFSPEAKIFIDQFFKPVDLGDDTIMVSFSLERFGTFNFKSTKENSFARFVLLHYQAFYDQIVGWVYQRQGLENTSTLSMARLHDESREFLLKSRPATWSLLFSTESWEIQKSWLAKYYEIFMLDQNAMGRIRLSPLLLSVPAFWPFAGVATVKESKLPGAPVELKRYFKNNMEDPLELFPKIPTRNEFELRHKLLFQTISALPSGTSLEIRSHSKVHTIAYRKLGFISQGFIQDPKYPGVYVELLKSTRENAMAKIEAILNKQSAANELSAGN